MLTAAALRLVEWLALAELFLSGGDHTKIMLSMLVVIFGGDWISRSLGVASKLDVFLGDMIRGAPNLHIGSVGFVNPRQWIVTLAAAAATAVAAAHPMLVLTVSHGLPVADS